MGFSFHFLRMRRGIPTLAGFVHQGSIVCRGGGRRQSSGFRICGFRRWFRIYRVEDLGFGSIVMSDYYGLCTKPKALYEPV